MGLKYKTFPLQLMQFKKNIELFPSEASTHYLSGCVPCPLTKFSLNVIRGGGGYLFLCAYTSTYTYTYVCYVYFFSQINMHTYIYIYMCIHALLPKVLLPCKIRCTKVKVTGILAFIKETYVNFEILLPLEQVSFGLGP